MRSVGVFRWYKNSSGSHVPSTKLILLRLRFIYSWIHEQPLEISKIIAHPKWTSFTRKCDLLCCLCHFLSSLGGSSHMGKRIHSCELVHFERGVDHIFSGKLAILPLAFWCCRNQREAGKMSLFIFFFQPKYFSNLSEGIAQRTESILVRAQGETCRASAVGCTALPFVVQSNSIKKLCA